jgi:nicotinamidase/pyrazinamidase
MEALIVVDVQNDFCPGGALAVEHGDEVIDKLNQMAAEHELVVATRDWHPSDHDSFDVHGGQWPVHCVQDTPGAELHPDLNREAIDHVVDKGQDASTEGYSGFEGTDLEQLLRDQDVNRVHIGGLALDYCVKNTALDAKRRGFDTVVHLGATRAVDVESGDGERAIKELRDAGVEIAD